MKKLLIASISMLLAGLYGCGNNNQGYPAEQNNVTVSPMSKNVDIQADKDNEAFDVAALSTIVKKSTDPKVLEQQINSPDNDINNLDLDKDGKIDYLTVTETGDDQLEVKDASVDPSVTVATLTITPNNTAQTASMQIQGNPAYTGANNYYYQPSISFGELLFMSYLMSPHSYYAPMYGYRHYPSYYTSHTTVVRTVYRPAPSQYVSNKAGVSRRSSLGAPSGSQRSFGARSSATPAGSGGFGRSASPSRPVPSFRSSSSSPRRSFGRRR